MGLSEAKATELTYLFRIMQMIHELSSVEKIRRMLLAITTCGKVIGYRRAMLFEVDYHMKLIRGVLGCEKSSLNPEKPREDLTFENLAREVFECFENAESSDLTLLAKTFSVQLQCLSSALVKAARSNYPVLAEGCLSEFASDPFFNFFGTSCYVAVPISASLQEEGEASRSDVELVLAADRGKEGDRIDVNRISLLFSLAQQTSLAMLKLRETAESNRRLRILTKMSRAMSSAYQGSKYLEGMKLGMTMVCRSLHGTGCLLKDFTIGKTHHIKSVHEYSLSGADRDVAVAECFEGILERAAGRAEVISCDGTYPLLNDEAGVNHFIACPLVSNEDVVGALAVYVEKNDSKNGKKEFAAKEKMFLELCSGIFASAISSRAIEERVKRDESFLEEVRSNLNREREGSRLGEKGLEYAQKISDELGKMSKMLAGNMGRHEVLRDLKTLHRNMTKQTTGYLEKSSSVKSNFRMVDIFGLTRKLVVAWRKKIEAKGIEVVVKIPPKGPRLLMDSRSISLALDHILSSIGSNLAEGNKALIECDTDGEKVMIIFADTGIGLPGNLLSRLFMPFCDVAGKDERKNALTLAGDIISKHGGEINMKSSLNWKTILVLSFRKSTNQDRRKSSADRRRGAADRRAGAKSRSNRAS